MPPEPGRVEAGLTAADGCAVCGFALWLPVADLSVSRVGLYDDARFPGRSLLVLKEHYEDLLEVPQGLAEAYFEDLRRYGTALRAVTGAGRLNFAVLGNAVAHVHWHVFPRHRDLEPNPHRSPWDDPRPRGALTPVVRDRLISEIRHALE